MDPSNVEEGQKGIKEVNDKEVDAGNTNGTEKSDDCDLSALSLWERDANTDDDVNSVTMDNRKNDDVRGDNGLTVNEVKETTMISTSEVTPKSQKENSSDFVSPSKDRHTTLVSDGIQSESVKDLGSGIDKQKKDGIADTELLSEKKDVLLKTFNTNNEPSLTTTTGPQKTTGSLSIRYADSGVKSSNFSFLDQVTQKKATNHRHRTKDSARRNPDATKDGSSSGSDKLKSCPKCQKLCKLFDFCENCMICFCKSCFVAAHRSQAKDYINHVIARDVPVYAICCATHGEINRYYCQDCKKKKCSDCLVLGSVCKSHKISKLTDHVQYKKSVLQEAGNKLTSQCSNISDHLRKAIWRQEEKLKLQTIAQKERLSQEFTSMRELLSEKEAYLCNQMDQSLCDSLDKLSDLRAKAGEELEESGHLTSLLLDIVNEPSFTKALTDMDKFEDRGRNHMDKLKQLRNSRVKEVTVPSVLFSLYQEKTRILQSISLESFSKKLFRAKSHTIFIPEEKIFLPVCASDLISPQGVLPPSTSYTLNLTILSCHRPKHQLDRITISDLNNMVLNGPGLVQLGPDERYLMKFEVERTLQLAWESEHISREIIHILVVTYNTMIVDEPSAVEGFYLDCCHRSREFSFHIKMKSFEEARFDDRQRPKAKGSKGKLYMGVFGGSDVWTSITATDIFREDIWESLQATEGVSVFGENENEASRECIATCGINIRYEPTRGWDTIVEYGISRAIQTQNQCITAMTEYSDKSLEELRYEDYIAGRKGWRHSDITDYSSVDSDDGTSDDD